MWLDILLYGFVIVWGVLAFVAYNIINKIFKKYRNIKEVEDTHNWKGIKRTDFNKWDQKAIIRGCFIRFPYKFTIGIIQFLTFILLVFSQNFLRKIHRNLDKFLIKKILFPIVNTIYEVTEHEHFSGPNTPIIISNHVNWFDIYYYGGRMHPISFVAKAEISKNFVLRNLAAKMQVILLDRVSESSRSSTIEKIEARINDYNRDNYNYNPIVIFPEGTTSNGKSILRFKIGAFHNKSKITIVGFNYSCDGFGMGMDEFGPFEHLFISLCLKPKLQVKFKQMEAMQEESAEAYMLRCQQQLSRMTGYPIEDSGYKEKLLLKQARWGKKQA